MAFGNYINKKNATIIGLISEIDLDRIRNIGNGAVAGANLALINRRKRSFSMGSLAGSRISNSTPSHPSWMNTPRAHFSRILISHFFPVFRYSSIPFAKGKRYPDVTDDPVLQIPVQPGSAPSRTQTRSAHARRARTVPGIFLTPLRYRIAGSLKASSLMLRTVPGQRSG